MLFRETGLELITLDMVFTTLPVNQFCVAAPGARWKVIHPTPVERGVA